MNEITYTYLASPQFPEKLKRDLRERRGEIASRLDLFEIPWENEFFGIDTRNGLEMRLAFDGAIRVAGSNEQKCHERISEIQKTLTDLLGSLPYEKAKLEQVKFERQAEAAISKIVPSEILEIVSKKISPDYCPYDVSYQFKEMPTGEDLKISFERTSYKKGEKTVPLRITVIASRFEICEEILRMLDKLFKQ